MNGIKGATWGLLVAVAMAAPATMGSRAAAQPNEPPPTKKGAEIAPQAAGEAAEGRDGKPPTDRGAGPRSPVHPSQVELAEEVERLREQVRDLEDRMDFESEQNARRAREQFRFDAYLDMGAFWAQGDGSGIRPDINQTIFPQYMGVVPGSWVFYGDPLATMINARGDPADTGESRAVTFDSANSQGSFSFLVNTLTLSGFYAPRDDLMVGTLIDFVPRTRDASNPEGVGLGDFVDIQIAYLEYRKDFDAVGLEVSAGKFDSVLGVEYRTQDAPDRLEVTPSLLCRYTCGRGVGVKLRLLFLEDRSLVLNTALTNGAPFAERFAYTADVDTNDAPSGAARLSYKLPIGQGIEIGASGLLGAQDLQESNQVLHWHAGGDVLMDWDIVAFAAELVWGSAQGDTEPGEIRCGLAPCLSYRGTYGRIGARVTNWLMPYVRSDFRRAVHRDGASFVYETRIVRVTTGLRFEINAHFLAKAEYTHTRELGSPQIPDDVMTTSFVVHGGKP